MKKIILPSTITDTTTIIDKIMVFDNFVIGTTAGLIKKDNEDTLGCVVDEDFIRICISDGHWGNDTSRLLNNYWLSKVGIFPDTKEKAIEETKKVEQEIFEIFGKTEMDPEKDFTPEAAFIAVEIVRNKLSIVSYGDCRLLIVSDGKIKFSLETSATWLGAFSHLKIKNRLSIKQGIQFTEIDLDKGDTIIFFTDGVDQCIYDKDTVSFDTIAIHTKNTSVTNAFDNILKEVFANGAEDNASMGILKQ